MSEKLRTGSSSKFKNKFINQNSYPLKQSLFVFQQPLPKRKNTHNNFQYYQQYKRYHFYQMYKLGQKIKPKPNPKNHIYKSISKYQDLQFSYSLNLKSENDIISNQSKSIAKNNNISRQQPHNQKINNQYIFRKRRQTVNGSPVLKSDNSPSGQKFKIKSDTIKKDTDNYTKTEPDTLLIINSKRNNLQQLTQVKSRRFSKKMDKNWSNLASQNSKLEQYCQYKEACINGQK